MAHCLQKSESNVIFALTKIKGLGGQFIDVMCKKVEVDVNKNATELTADESKKTVTIIMNPCQFKIPI